MNRAFILSLYQKIILFGTCVTIVTGNIINFNH